MRRLSFLLTFNRSHGGNSHSLATITGWSTMHCHCPTLWGRTQYCIALGTLGATSLHCYKPASHSQDFISLNLPNHVIESEQTFTECLHILAGTCSLQSAFQSYSGIHIAMGHHLFTSGTASIDCAPKSLLRVHSLFLSSALSPSSFYTPRGTHCGDSHLHWGDSHT